LICCSHAAGAAPLASRTSALWADGPMFLSSHRYHRLVRIRPLSGPGATLVSSQTKSHGAAHARLGGTLASWLGKGRRPMKRIDAHTHRCKVCNAVFWSKSEAVPLAVIKTYSGQPTVRVISVGGEEVHRCAIGKAPRSVR